MGLSNKEEACRTWAVTCPMMVAKGLEGVVADTSNICLIDGNAGCLMYDIHDLVSNVSFEKVAHLLWYGDLPTRSQLSDLKSHSDRRTLS